MSGDDIESNWVYYSVHCKRKPCRILAKKCVPVSNKPATNRPSEKPPKSFRCYQKPTECRSKNVSRNLQEVPTRICCSYLRKLHQIPKLQSFVTKCFICYIDPQTPFVIDTFPLDSLVGIRRNSEQSKAGSLPKKLLGLTCVLTFLGNRTLGTLFCSPLLTTPFTSFFWFQVHCISLPCGKAVVVIFSATFLGLGYVWYYMAPKGSLFECS